ncbi:helix-turn-helix protein [Paraburkholderia sp. BL18I3N2]|nr:helix-turn-helix protein [Paraburkholderia sp. BL18I3N2]PRX95922.1 helix-turn-helix protein [Paraburkholderia sp. BL25I1N1]
MKYAWIELHSRQWPVSLTCQVLGVSPSGYHARKARDVDTNRPRRRISNDALLVHIKAVHAQSKGEYGWPRVWKKLFAQGIRVSKDRVQRLMKLHGIKAKTKRRFKASTAHRAAHAVALKQVLEVMTAILATPVAMDDQARFRPAAKPCHTQRVRHQLRAHVRLHRQPTT